MVIKDMLKEFMELEKKRRELDSAILENSARLKEDCENLIKICQKLRVFSSEAEAESKQALETILKLQQSVAEICEKFKVSEAES